MNDPCQLMNQYQVMNRSQANKTNPSQQLMDQSQYLNQFQTLEIVSQSQMKPPQMLNLMVSQGQMFPQPPVLNQLNLIHQYCGNLRHQPMKFPNPNFGGFQQQQQGKSKWKGKNVRMKSVSGLNDIEYQSRSGRFFHKKKLHRMGPYAHAPRNTTSYLIRAKKEGGIASLVSPFPVTPAVLPTPVFSPSRESLVDMAKEEWGVDGYGSMKGLIRLRSSPGHEAEIEMDEYEDDSCESDVEEHLEVERRLDHDLSRFEMVYPGSDGGNVLGNRVDDQDSQILQLEEENLSLRERLYLMERELGDIKRRMHCLERENNLEQEEEEEIPMFPNVSGNQSEDKNG